MIARTPDPIPNLHKAESDEKGGGPKVYSISCYWYGTEVLDFKIIRELFVVFYAVCRFRLVYSKILSKLAAKFACVLQILPAQHLRYTLLLAFYIL